MPDGRIGHAELRVGDTVFMLAGEFPEERHLEPDDARRQHASALMLHVPDSDATYARPSSDGAEALRPVAEEYGARQGVIRDPFGHRWFVATAVEADDVPVEDVPGRRFGDIGYMTLEVARRRPRRAVLRRAVRLGARRAATSPARSTSRRSHRRPASTAGQATPEVRLYFRVDDIEAAAAPGPRARRPGAVGRPTTTPAATPSASTTKACASTSSAPAPATDPVRVHSPLVQLRGETGARAPVSTQHSYLGRQSPPVSVESPCAFWSIRHRCGCRATSGGCGSARRCRSSAA